MQVMHSNIALFYCKNAFFLCLFNIDLHVIYSHQKNTVGSRSELTVYSPGAIKNGHSMNECTLLIAPFVFQQSVNITKMIHGHEMCVMHQKIIINRKGGH